MEKTENTLEELMSPAIREVVEHYRKKVGVIQDPPNDQEAMENEKCIYFWGLGSEATLNFIQRWAVVNEDWNALWFDEEYAKKSRWGGIIAPPLYLISVQDGLAIGMEVWNEFYLPGGATPNIEKFPDFLGGPQGESEWEFFEPVRPGDKITVEHKLADFRWHWSKPGKIHKRILYVTGETTFYNQNKKLIAKNRSVGLLLFK